MKRTSGYVGLGSVLISILVGACLTDRDKPDTSSEAITRPEAALPDVHDASDVVLAVRTQIQRAFGNATITLPGSTGPARAIGSFDVVGAKTAPSVEFMGMAGVTGEVGKVKADLTLPARADGAFKLRDDVSGVSVDVGLVGATASAREEANGYIVYRAGYATGAHIVHRPTGKGTEDFVYFPNALPETPELRYKLALGDGVAGLRLVAKTIEMLDAAGTPRLRMAPPYAVDGNGQRLAMSVAIEGCAYDQSFEMPWGRPTVNPGARECTVRLSWPAEAKAPLVVDPVWSLTSDMIDVRQNATVATVPAMIMSKFRAIVVGGDQGTPTTALASTEIFDETTNTWTAGPPLNIARTEHAMVTSGQSLIVIGGRANNNTTLRSVERLGFNANNTPPLQAQWLPGPQIATQTGRARAVATSFDGGRIFVAGGITINMGSEFPLNSVEIFEPAAGGSWTAPQVMQKYRVGHAMAVVPNTATGVLLQVYIVGGMKDGGLLHNNFERCEVKSPTDPNAPLLVGCTLNHEDNVPFPPLKQNRVNAVAFVAHSKLHIIGGDGQKTAETYKPGDMETTELVSKMAVPRAFFTATQSPFHDDRYLIVGGDSGNNTREKTTEIYDPVAESFAPDQELTTPRARHNTVILSDDRPLVIGGALGNVGSAETLHCKTNDECFAAGTFCSSRGICTPLKARGEKCDPETDCWGGKCAINICASDNTCADGVCCNSDCKGDCEACNAAGECMPVTGSPVTNKEPGNTKTPKRNECPSGEGVCAAQCNGTSTACTYPQSDTTCDASCSMGAIETKGCDGMGMCSTVTAKKLCAPYACDAVETDQCATLCVEAVGGMGGTGGTGTMGATGCHRDADCKDGVCIPRPTSCIDDNTMKLANGDEQPCGFYRCDPVLGRCLTECETAYDCKVVDPEKETPYVCNEMRQCVLLSDEPGTGGGTATCATSPSNESSRFGWFAALALAGAVAARRNRARA